jgi:hypothetical protein
MAGAARGGPQEAQAHGPRVTVEPLASACAGNNMKNPHSRAHLLRSALPGLGQLLYVD